MRSTIIVCIVAALLVGCDGSDAGQADTLADTTGMKGPGHVGFERDSLPPNMQLRESTVLLGPGTTPNTARYAITWVGTADGDVLWLDTLVSPAGSPAARWRVRAELAVPTLGADEALVIGQCRLHGRLDPEIVAIAARGQTDERYTQVRQAWRANRATHRFEPLLPDDVDCENQDYGG